MNRHPCQICGRRKGLKKNGTVVMHHVRGERCQGTGHPSLDYSHDALAAEIERLRAEAQKFRKAIRRLEDRRANWIDPRYAVRQRELERQADKLARRLKRHLGRPARYRRQMETRGWSDESPPQYLLDMGL